jgi:hypothetical protein
LLFMLGEVVQQALDARLSHGRGLRGARVVAAAGGQQQRAHSHK